MHSVSRLLGSAALWCSGEYDRIRYLSDFEKTQFLSPRDIEQLQIERANKILKHAFEKCAYYRKKFEACGITPKDIQTLEDWRHLPVLEKRDIQSASQEMLSVDWPPNDLIANQTGGSTGEPISFYLHRDRVESRCGATMRHDGWAGLNIGDHVAYVWGAPRDIPRSTWRTKIRHRLLGRQLWLDTALLTESAIIYFNEQLRRFRPSVIVAYAGGIVTLSRFLKSRSLTPYSPKSIITSAELLLPEDRLLVEEVFGCPVFNRYGCREFAVVASECDQHDGLHIMAEGLLVEIDTETQTTGSHEIGSVLVTDLLNHAMPLIRYRIGDLAAWAEGTCRCGRGLPRLKEISGRITDFLVGSDGRLVSGVFLATYVVAHRPSLGRVQIIQDRKGHLLFRIQLTERFSPNSDIPYLQNATAKYLGDKATAEVQFVDEFPTEPSGKLLFSKSSVSADFMDL